MSSGQTVFWARHHGAIRAWVEGVAQGFSADPRRVYTGEEVDALLRANLDLTDARNDRFDDAPTPEDLEGDS